MVRLYILLALMFFVQPLFAEYYKYTDDNGVVCFTDNLADVPVAQRTDSNVYEEIISPQSGEVDQKKDSVSFRPNPQGKEGVEETEALSRMQELNKEKEILEIVYEQLVTKKQALKKEKISLSNSITSTVYREKVRKLNQEISDFENRRQAFEEKVKSFNAQTDRK